MTSKTEAEQLTIPEWDELGVPVVDDVEPEDAGPTHEHDVGGSDV